MKLDINNEREKLTTKYKKLWEFRKASIEELYQEGKIDSEQKEALLQTQMAIVRTADLKTQNEYNSKSGDFFAKRAIKKNEAEINRMERFYNDNTKIIGQSKIEKMEQEILNRTGKKIEKYNEQNKGRKQ